MPTITISKKALLEQLGRKISDEELGNRISMLGTGFEGMMGDDINVEIFPNRPDLLSTPGLARALSSFLGIRKGFKKYVVKKGTCKVIIDKSVKGIRPYTACAVVKNLKLTDEKIKEVIQIQEKLHITYGRNRKKAAIGIYPLEHIKPPIYYKALYPEEIKFKPLDLNKDLTGSQILAIHPTGREYGYLLEGKDKYPVFLDSKMQIMSMPPIINSNTVGKITNATRDVFIECSGFDFNYLQICLNMIVCALADLGGEIHSVELAYPEKKYVTPQLDGREMKLEPSYVEKILGIHMQESDIKKCAELMGYEYKNKKMRIPGFRADILHPVDLVEDIAIAYGYENFTGNISRIPTVASEKPLEVFKNKLREIAIGTGLIEVKNFHLTSKDKQTKKMNTTCEVVELLNAITQEYNVLRYWMTPHLLETLQSNKQYDYPQHIFEIGTVFKHDPQSDTGVRESEVIGIAFCGHDANFTRIKQFLDSLAEALAINYTIEDTHHESFIKGRVGRIQISNAATTEKIGLLGELHPQVLVNWGLDMPVAVLGINITDLFRILGFAPETFAETKAETKNATPQKIAQSLPRATSKPSIAKKKSSKKIVSKKKPQKKPQKKLTKAKKSSSTKKTKKSRR